MPTSVNQIKNKIEEKSMDMPVEPTHGYSIRVCAPLLFRTTLH
jgi:hypothetical protein